MPYSLTLEAYKKNLVFPFVSILEKFCSPTLIVLKDAIFDCLAADDKRIGMNMSLTDDVLYLYCQCDCILQCLLMKQRQTLSSPTFEAREVTSPYLSVFGMVA